MHRIDVVLTALPSVTDLDSIEGLAPGQAIDVERFRWFSDGYVALDPEDPNRVIDVRYSLVPDRIEALWGIELDRDRPPEGK